MRRVLMVSPHFPPDSSAGTHRVRLLAPRLAAVGWAPTVLTVTPESHETRLDSGLAGLVADELEVRRVAAWPSRLTRAAGVGDLGLRAFVPLYRAADALLASGHYQALFITIYPTYTALMGPRPKRRHGVPFVLDYQDPWVGSWGLTTGPDGHADLRSRASRALATTLEPRALAGADAVTAVSARTYQEALARYPGLTPRVVDELPIGFEPADRDVASRRPWQNGWFAPDDGCVHFCYVGTLLPAGVGVLRVVLMALADLRQRAPQAYARVRVHFFGTSNQRGAHQRPRVMPEAQRAGVDDVVTEEPSRLDYLDALRVLMDADATLLMGSDEPHYTPSKVFAALLAGRPMLAVHHAASTVTSHLAGHPAATAFSFAGPSELTALVPAISRALEQRAMAPKAGNCPIPAAWQPWSAEALAGRLGQVFDAVCA